VTKRRRTLLILGILALLAVVVGTIGAVTRPDRLIRRARFIKRTLKNVEGYIANEEFDKAVIAYKKLVAVDPKNPEMHFAAAKVYEQAAEALAKELDDFQKVVDGLRDQVAKKKEESRDENSPELAGLQKELEDKLKELTELRQKLKDYKIGPLRHFYIITRLEAGDESTLAPLKRVGEFFYEHNPMMLGELREVAKKLQKLAPADPKDQAKVQLWLGACAYHADKNNKEAKSCAEEALELDKTLAGAYILLAAVERDAGRKDEAIKYYADALEEAADKAPIYLERGRYYRHLGGEARRMGDFALARDMFEKARKDLTEAAKDTKTSFLVHLDLARLDLIVGEKETAEKRLVKASEIAPEEPRVWLILGDFCNQEQRQLDAMNHYTRALELLSENREAGQIFLLTRGLIRAKDFPRAEAQLKRLNDILKERGALWTNLLHGKLELVQGNWEAAIPYLVKAAQAKPLHEFDEQLKADATGSLGYAYRKVKYLSQAQARLREAITLQPENSAYRLLLADVLLSQKDYNGAVAAVEEAVAKNRADVRLRVALAKALTARGAASAKSGNAKPADKDFQQAVYVLTQATKADGSNTKTWLLLAELLMSHEDFDRADATLAEAREAGANAWAILLKRMQVASKRGDLDAALRHAEELADVGQDKTKARVSLLNVRLARAVYRKDKDPAGASDEIREAHQIADSLLKEAPASPLALCSKALCYAAEDKQADAEKLFLAALTSTEEPTREAIVTFLRAYSRIKKTENAAAVLEAALKKHPDRHALSEALAEVYVTCAVAARKDNDTAKALKWTDDALKTFRKLAEAYSRPAEQSQRAATEARKALADARADEEKVEPGDEAKAREAAGRVRR